MATTKETAAAKTATTPPVPLTLQQKFIKLREAVPSITQKAHSDLSLIHISEPTRH